MTKIVLCCACGEILVPNHTPNCYPIKCYPPCGRTHAELRADKRMLELKGPCIAIGLDNDDLDGAVEYFLKHGEVHGSLSIKSWLISEPSKWIARVKKLTSLAKADNDRQARHKAKRKVTPRPPSSIRNLKYVNRLPTQVPPDRVLVHTLVELPDLPNAWGRGRYVWLQSLDSTLEVCPCAWAPDLGPHYRRIADFGRDPV
jgi:hypothetical protein